MELFNDGGTQNQRWINLVSITLPATSVIPTSPDVNADAKQTVIRISFNQDIRLDTDYYMILQFRTLQTGIPSSVPFNVNGVLTYPTFMEPLIVMLSVMVHTHSPTL